MTLNRWIGIGAVLLAFGNQAGSQGAGGLQPDVFRPAGVARVLFFVMSDCPIANGYAREIQQTCGAFAPRGVACTLVYEDLRIDDAAVRRHHDEFKYSSAITAVIDADRAIATRAKATVTPQAIVVDRGGAVRYRGRIDNRYAAIGKPRRVVTVHDLHDALEAVLAGRPVATPETTAFGCDIVSRSFEVSNPRAPEPPTSRAPEPPTSSRKQP